MPKRINPQLSERLGELKEAYESNPRTSIRIMAAEHEVGYATMRTLLLAGGTTLRSRGGSRRASR